MPRGALPRLGAGAAAGASTGQISMSDLRSVSGMVTGSGQEGCSSGSAGAGTARLLGMWAEFPEPSSGLNDMGASSLCLRATMDATAGDRHDGCNSW